MHLHSIWLYDESCNRRPSLNVTTSAIETRQSQSRCPEHIPNASPPHSAHMPAKAIKSGGNFLLLRDKGGMAWVAMGWDGSGRAVASPVNFPPKLQHLLCSPGLKDKRSTFRGGITFPH